jgi:2-hydroxy fatty acid dioxygenase
MGRIFGGFTTNLVDQLVFYGSYHSNPINKIIHVIFVPIIWWSVAVWLAATPVLSSADVGTWLPFLPGTLTRHLVLNGSFVLFLTYASYYILLEPIAGLTWTAFLGVPMWASANAYFATAPNAWLSALGLHVLSWQAQIIVGHNMAEKRKPALMDSFFQSLVLAPLFVWFEILFFVGYRKGLGKEVEQKIQKNIEAWKKTA